MIFGVARILCLLSLAMTATNVSAFSTHLHRNAHPSPLSSSSIHFPRVVSLDARRPPAGPIARAKKLFDPVEYDRVVTDRMERSKMSREEAEADYNDFLENPPMYYALDKKEEYYKSLGYKDFFEGMIGEAEKEGKGDEMREYVAKFKLKSKIKAYSVIAVAILVFIYVQNIYNVDPENFMKGGLPDYSSR